MRTTVLSAAIIMALALTAPASDKGAVSDAGAADEQSHAAEGKMNFNSDKILSMIDEAIAKRTEQAQKATAKGKTDIAAAIQKIITDLNSMKTAVNNKDKDAFEKANEQRQKDRQALRTLITSEKGSGEKGMKKASGQASKN